MVVTADDMGHAHVMIVDHHRQHVGRRPVGAEQDEIVELGIGHCNAALDEILDHRLAVARGLDPHHARQVVGRIIAVAPFAGDTKRLALRLRSLAPGGQLLGGQIAAIGMARLDQLVGDFGMPRFELRLEPGLAIASDPEPRQAVEDRIDRWLGRALGVGILDAQQISAAVVPGEQPVEQCRTRSADMEVAGRRGGEAGHHAGDFRACAQRSFPLVWRGRWTGRAPLT